jgi:hypothetical protein
MLIKQKQIDNLVNDLGAKAMDSQVVKKANNLSDVNAASARTNLDTYSKAEVQSMIAGVDNAHSVADLAARSALSGLKVTDRVFVNDDGDGNWALYIVVSITDGSGATSEYVKVADEDIFSNAMSAAAIKTSYESNADTNAFTDAEKTKLGHISVSQAVNLDSMESELASTSAAASNAQTAANLALSNAADAQSTADNALTNASLAQSTANNALTTANGKEDIFTQILESFTGMNGEANMAQTLNLSQSLADGFVPQVFFNGLLVDNVTYTAGQASIDFEVPYLIEPSDLVVVFYAYN